MCFACAGPTTSDGTALVEGSPCVVEASRCGGGLSCNGATTPASCQRERSLELGQPCSSALFCREGLACIGEPRGTCEPPRGEGGSCDRTSSCAAPLRCLGADRRCGSPRGEGEPCAGDLDDDDCAPSLVCNRGSSRCQLPATSAQDERCGESGDCAEGLRCIGRGAGRICTTPLAASAPCDDDDACADGLRCNRAVAPARCLPEGREGDPCSRQRECAGGFSCGPLGLCR